jgi:hypothetical protein
MFNYESKKSEVSLFVLRSLVFVLVTLGCVFNAKSAPESNSEAKAKAMQMMRQAMTNLKEQNPNVEITRSLMENELGKMQAKAKFLPRQEQKKIRVIKEKLRTLEKEIIEKAINRKHTEYLEKTMVGKYNIPNKKAFDMILNHDERAYIVLREIIMNSKD